jgi:hypothetical protein
MQYVSPFSLSGINLLSATPLYLFIFPPPSYSPS